MCLHLTHKLLYFFYSDISLTPLIDIAHLFLDYKLTLFASQL